MRTLTAVVLALLAGAASAADGKAKLAGTWTSELDGTPLTLELRPDGTASFMGQAAQWQVLGDMLVVGTSAASYRLESRGMILTDMQGRVTVWQRAGGARSAKGAAAGGKATPGNAAAGKNPPVDAQLRQLLVSSAWCSFQYNKNTGTTKQSRAVFAADGTLHLGTDAQTYNSGAAGSVAGQYQTGSGMRWAVQNGRLLIDSGEGLQDVGLQVNRNSSGYPILVVDGKEYASCR